MNNENEKNVKEEFADVERIFRRFFKGIKENRKQDLNKDAIAICNITKEQAKQGLNKNVKISVADICDTCKGTGKEIGHQDKECEICYDTGFIYNEQNIVVNIPPKIKNNDYLVFKGKGNRFNIDDERGDLYIKIHIYGNKSNREGRKIYV